MIPVFRVCFLKQFHPVVPKEGMRLPFQRAKHARILALVFFRHNYVPICDSCVLLSGVSMWSLDSGVIGVGDLGECIQCTATNVIATVFTEIDNVVCTDPFPGTMSIQPELPSGLLLRDGVLQGKADSGKEVLVYTISSSNRRSLPFLLRLGGAVSFHRSLVVIERPSSLYIDPQDLAIPRGIQLLGIQVHSNTVISSLLMDPLPEGLVIDPVKMTIAGEYSGTWSGARNITLRAENTLGVFERTFLFVFTSPISVLHSL